MRVSLDLTDQQGRILRLPLGDLPSTSVQDTSPTAIGFKIPSNSNIPTAIGFSGLYINETVDAPIYSQEIDVRVKIKEGDETEFKVDGYLQLAQLLEIHGARLPEVDYSNTYGFASQDSPRVLVEVLNLATSPATTIYETGGNGNGKGLADIDEAIRVSLSLGGTFDTPKLQFNISKVRYVTYIEELAYKNGYHEMSAVFVNKHSSVNQFGYYHAKLIKSIADWASIDYEVPMENLVICSFNGEGFEKIPLSRIVVISKINEITGNHETFGIASIIRTANGESNVQLSGITSDGKIMYGGQLQDYEEFVIKNNLPNRTTPRHIKLRTIEFIDKEDVPVWNDYPRPKAMFPNDNLVGLSFATVKTYF